MRILFNELSKYKISLLFILVLTYLATTFEVTLPLLLANALNVGITLNYGMKYIKYTAIMMLTLMLIIIIFNFIITNLIIRVGTYASESIKNNLFEKTLKLKNNEFNKFPISTLITRTNQDIELIKNFIISLLSIIFKAPILLFSCITVLKFFNQDFFIVLIIAIIGLLAFLSFITLKLLPLSKKLKHSQDTLNMHLKNKIAGFKLIKSYSNLELENKNFLESNKTYLHDSIKTAKLSSFVNPTLTFIVNIVTITILFMCINISNKNLTEAGTIIATIQYILQILLSIVMLSSIVITLPTIKVSLNRIKETLSSQTYQEENIGESINEIQSITFDNVDFSYNNTDLLNNLNLCVNKGENIGIIGLNGSGKSTIAKLILKEIKNNSGNIKINNMNIEKISRKSITKSITYVPQTQYMLKGTILENLAFSESDLTMNDIAKALHTCNLENFINSKKENINYMIEESGNNLSGGQKQRISLARALVRKSNLIILDEPFSALDYKTEKEILTKLNTFYKEKNFIIISQRISSIMSCNKILVLDKGNITHIGTHQELLENCPLYKEIYSIQKEVIEYDI